MTKVWDCMKKLILMVLLCLAFPLLLIGCGKENTAAEETAQTAQIGNPWKEWSTLKEAENAVAFSFGLPEVIAQRYTVSEVRTMLDELLEVRYRDGEYEVCVRKQKGEGQDLSGDYNQYDFVSERLEHGASVTTYHNSDNPAVKQIVSYQGYSWSVVAPNGYGEEADGIFLEYIWNTEE